MSTMRLLTRVAPLAIALAVFLFGTQLVAQTTYKWTPTVAVGTDYMWAENDNWTPVLGSGTTYPGDGATTDDIVVFDGTASTTPPKMSASALIIAQLDVQEDQELELDRALTVTSAVNLTAGKTLKLIRNDVPGQLTVSGLITFNSGSQIVGDAGAAEPGKIYLSGTVDMGSNPTLNNTTHFGEDLLTVIANKDFMLSDVVFLDDIDITGVGIDLGSNDLYLGRGADVITELIDPTTQFDWASSSKATAGGYIRNLGGNANTGQGRLKKEFDDLGQDFLFPVGQAATPNNERYTPMYILLDCADPTTISTTPNFYPFPYISVRVVVEGGGNTKGHPANQNKDECQVYWIVKGGGLPTEAYYPSSSPSIGLSGVMFFSNAYRTGTPSFLYSAVFSDIDSLSQEWGNNEDTDNYDPNDYIGPWPNSAWFTNGSVQVYTFQTDTREIPFGRGTYNGWVTPSVDGLYPYSGNTCTIGFGDYTAGVGNDILPVELTSFSGRFFEDNRVQLSWLTTTEENNLGFWVERSTDGEKWETLPDFVQGAGNSSVPLSYEYTDNLDDRLAQAPKIAYRLRQVDRDGTIDYSSIVYVYTGSRPETVELYRAYPNPFNPSTTLSFSLEETQNVTLRVYNTLGMEVATLLDNRSMEAGFHNIEFNGNDLVSGIYIAVLEAAGVVQQQKLVLSK